jgi:hypothetical protein
VELDNIILSEVSQAQKAKIVYSSSYVNYRPKTFAAILLNMGHMLGGECIQEEYGKRRKTKI